MSRRIWAALLAGGAILLLLASGYLAYAAQRRVQPTLTVLHDPVRVPGHVLEKRIEQQPDTLLPVMITTHSIRYAFVNPQGHMRTGEQIVTARFYRQVGEQGAPLPVYVLPAQPAVSSITPRLTYPAQAGWRAGLALLGLLAAAGVAALSIVQFKLATQQRHMGR